MIIRKDDLESAVEHGIISASSAKALAEFTLKRSKAPRAVNEHFRLFSNFSEIFIVLGLLIIFSATRGIIGIFGLEFAVAGAIAFWLVAEFFTRKTTKMAPALAAALFACFFAVKSFLYFANITPFGILQANASHGGTVFAAVTVALVIAFFRFRIPALLALILPAVTTAILFFAGMTDLKDPSFLWPIGLCGLTAIVIAIWFDSRDPLRRSRQNAYAFWLFVVGSPMMVHPLFASIWLNGDFKDPDAIIPMVFALAVLITLLGLVLDRRSLVASSLIYFTVSLGYFNNALTDNIATTLAVTSLLVGSFVVILGVLWYRLRGRLLHILPLGKLAAKLPPSS
jgi:hypothetical protein